MGYVVPMNTTDVLLTEDDLATRWNISRAKLRNDRWAGRSVPFLRLQRTVRYRLSDVEAYEESRRVVQQPTPPAVK